MNSYRVHHQIVYIPQDKDVAGTSSLNQTNTFKRVLLSYYLKIIIFFHHPPTLYFYTHSLHLSERIPTQPATRVVRPMVLPSWSIFRGFGSAGIFEVVSNKNCKRHYTNNRPAHVMKMAIRFGSDFLSL